MDDGMIQKFIKRKTKCERKEGVKELKGRTRMKKVRGVKMEAQ